MKVAELFVLTVALELRLLIKPVAVFAERPECTGTSKKVIWILGELFRGTKA